MIKYGKINGVDKKVSRYIMGTAYITTPTAKPEQIEHLNDAFETGINTIDSAHSYGAPNVGSTEIALGKWIKESGIKREDIVIMSKCGHPAYFDFDPFLSRSMIHPFDMESELYDTLCKFYTDYVDVLYLHRDDPKVPVEVIIDTLNRFKKEGMVKAFGAANWSIERVKEANAYAEANGLQGFSIIEEHFSLAEMVGDPFMQGSGTISGPKYKAERQYCVDTQIPVASYSPLSGGFCVGFVTREKFAADPDKIPEGMRIGYCYPDNFTRMERAAELAKHKGVTVPQIAMAYTMATPMDVFPIIGANNHAELISSLEALDITLTQAECDWMDLTSDERPF